MIQYICYLQVAFIPTRESKRIHDVAYYRTSYVLFNFQENENNAENNNCTILTILSYFSFFKMKLADCSTKINSNVLRYDTPNLFGLFSSHPESFIINLPNKFVLSK